MYITSSILVLGLVIKPYSLYLIPSIVAIIGFEVSIVSIDVNPW
jgi:hypothetical protein